MQTTKKPRNIEITSPRGVFAFPALDKPDYGTDEYPKPQGVFKVSLIMKKEDPATKAFLAQLEPVYKEAVASAEQQFAQLPVSSRKKHGEVKLNPLYVDRYDRETEELTGEIEFRISMDSSGTFKTGPKSGEKWTRKPLLFDASGGRITDPPEIWGGTEGKVRVQLRPYFIAGTAACGVKLGLLAVQILSLVEGGGQSADQLGFEPEEGGYVAPAKDEFVSDEIPF